MFMQDKRGFDAVNGKEEWIKILEFTSRSLMSFLSDIHKIKRKNLESSKLDILVISGIDQSHIFSRSTGMVILSHIHRIIWTPFYYHKM